MYNDINYSDTNLFFLKDEKINKKKLLDFKKTKNIHCNLCDKVFKPKSKFERFCHDCKEENEDYLDYERY